NQLWIIAANTGGGKSSMALQIATHAAAQGVTTMFFSLEMSKEELFYRMICQHARVSDPADPAVFDQVNMAVRHVIEQQILWDDDAHTCPAISASIRRESCRHKKPGLVIVDYLQLMRAVGRTENRAKEVGANSRALKLLAKEFAVPVVALSQLNRESVKEG